MEENLKIDFKNYFHIVKRKWKFISVIILLVLITSLVYNLSKINSKNTYTSNISILIDKPINNFEDNKEQYYNEVTMYQYLVKTYNKFLKEDVVLQDVIQELRLKKNVAQLNDMISSKIELNTNFISITVISQTPTEAKSVADQVAKSLKKVMYDIYGIDNVKIIGNAVVPEIVTNQNSKLFSNILKSLAIGIAFSIILVFFLEYIDNSIKSADEIEKSLKAPILGKITQYNGNKFIKFFKNSTIVNQDEEYKILRININECLKNSNCKNIAITSCNKFEGKSTIIYNLAVSIAETGKKVLLLDCDLKNPIVHEKAKISNKVGLTNIILDDLNIKDAIQATSINNLSVITSGKIIESSSKILETDKMKNLFKELKEDFEIVLVDTTEINGVSDALIVSSLVDGTLLLGSYRKTYKITMLRGKESIIKSGGNVIGLIINKIPFSEKLYCDNYVYNREFEVI